MRHHALHAAVSCVEKLIWLSLFGLVLSCGSRLPGIIKNNEHPVDKVDFTQVYFDDLETGGTINVADYMKEKKLNYMLLLFGSSKCDACNKKAFDLSHHMEGKHDLLLHSEQKQFDLKGVNADTGSAMRFFQNIMLDPQKKADLGYDFIKWHDGEGKVLKKFFMAKNDLFGLPYTVMINRDGILWRYNNEGTHTIQEILDRAEATINGHDSGDKGGGGNGGGGGDDNPTVKDLTTELHYESAKRFTKVAMSDCSGVADNLQNIVSGADVTFVQISKDSCADKSNCSFNYAQFANVTRGGCSGAHLDDINCRFVTLTLPDPAAERCATGAVYKGGQEFFDVFATHFNWSYDPNLDQFGAPASIKDVEGPIVLGFRSNGELIYSWEGALPDLDDPRSIRSVLASGATERAKGINLPMFDGSADQDFAALRQKARFTVLGTFDRFCGSCVEELGAWSAKNHIASFCASHSDFCQVVALEGELARPNTADGRTAFFNDIMTKFLKPRSVTIPLLIDETAFTDYSKIFDSYLAPLFPEWKGVYGAVIYDREGKILADFKSDGPVDPDPVLETLKLYLKKGR